MVEFRHSSITIGAFFAAASILCLHIFKQQREGKARGTSAASKRKDSSNDKFAPKDGITFYYFPRSPCARRVWVTLLAKKIKCEMVMVNIMVGEQRNAAFLAINPQGKVPAIRCHNHATIPNCILYESQAIVEWLDEQFQETLPLYPCNFTDRINVKMWQYWELSMAEDMWPLSRQQVDGIIWRFTYSRESFYNNGPPKDANSDPFYSNKVSRVYEGTYLSPADARRRALRTLRAFKMLDMALGDEKFKSSLGHSNTDMMVYLVGETFTQADVAVYPRLCKVPQNGLVSSEEERSLFPHVCEYFKKLRECSVFEQFAAVDELIWESGKYPKFVPQWWGSWLPWWFIVAVGNWRAGLKDFTRITQSSLGGDAIEKHLELVTATPLMVIPSVPLYKDEECAAFKRHSWRSDQMSDSESINSEESLFHDVDYHSRDEGVATLYCHPALPLAVATRACLLLQSNAAALRVSPPATPAPYAASIPIRHHTIDIVRLEHLTPEYLRLMPMGEVPVLAHGQRIVYGPHIIVEYMDEMLFSKQHDAQHHSESHKTVTFAASADPSSNTQATCRLLPQSPDDRAVVRRWFGWCRTAFFYQIEPLYNAHVLPTNVRKSGISSKEDFASVANEAGVSSEEAITLIEKCFPSPTKAEEGIDREKHAYVSELLLRIDTVESELRTSSRDSYGKSLLGHVHFTYADYFVLAVVLLSEVYNDRLIRRNEHPFVHAWKQALLRNSVIATLYLEMCHAHGANMKVDWTQEEERAQTPILDAPPLIPLSPEKSSIASFFSLSS